MWICRSLLEFWLVSRAGGSGGWQDVEEESTL